MTNKQEVISHSLPEACSDKLEMWLAHDRAEAQKSTLGLSWHCDSDTLRYKHRLITYNQLTMRNLYHILASQNDHLGYILPSTTRVKIIVQQLWAKHRDWDDPNLPDNLLQQWFTWEKELEKLPHITLRRCYTA